MFLDDELYNKYTGTTIASVEDFKDMVMSLMDICQNHLAKNLVIGETTYAEYSTLLEKVFNSWNLFVDRITKEKLPFSMFVEKDMFKSAWMESEELKEIYLRGK